MKATLPQYTALVTCEHATDRLPACGFEVLVQWAKNQPEHRRYDPGALPVAKRIASTLRARFFEGRWSRLLVDLNRSPGHPKLHGEPYRNEPADRRAATLQTYYHPFREKVLENIRLLLLRELPLLHLSVHTFDPEAGAQPRPTRIGILYDPARAPEKNLACAWIEQLKNMKPAAPDFLPVHANRPYRGTSDGHVTALRQQFPENLYLGIEVEIAAPLALNSPDSVTDVLLASLRHSTGATCS